MHEVERDLHGRLRAALSAARLQHVELAAFDRELEVLHVAIMRFELLCDRDELRVDFGLRILQIGDLLGRANPGDDVFTLRVAQVLTEEFARAGVRLARERHARTRVVAHVAEHHRDDADRGAPFIAHLVIAAVVDRAFGIPGVEHRADREIELFEHVLRKIAFRFALHHREVLRDQRFPVIGAELRVGLYAELRFRRIEQMVEVFFRNLEHDAREHRDEAPVRIEREALVAGELGQPRDRFVVEPEVEDRVHHTGHRDARTAAHGHEQRVCGHAEALFRPLLELAHRRAHLVLQTVGKAPADAIKFQTLFGRNDETGRHR